MRASCQEVLTLILIAGTVHHPQVNNMVYVFGGQLVKDGSASNELFWMTSERMEWHAQPTRGDRPAGRHGHVAIYDPDHHQLVVFGGR